MRPEPSSHAHHWTLDPDVVFLNHGSFGACPRLVLEHQAELRRQLEAQPVRFFVRELDERLHRAQVSLATFVGADAAGLAFVTNATTGVNTALQAVPLESGDEVLTTNHEYNACNNALVARAGKAGAKVVIADIPFPVADENDVVEALLSRVTHRTRLVLIDHITSQTALVLPIERIVSELKARDITIVIDGAHAPGMLDLNLSTLGADFYTGNCHKWICAPKGAAFLWVAPAWRSRTRPLVISHGANAPLGERSRFRLEFDWTGTQDPTAFLAIPAAIATLGALLPGGWRVLRERNRQLALTGRDHLCRALDIAPPCPDSMIGSLATLPLPDGSPEPPTSFLYADPLQDRLLEDHSIEVPIIPWPAPPKRLIRISAQLYNSEEQYVWLADGLMKALGRKRT